MIRKSNVGHIVTIKNTITGESEYLFLYITGEESAKSYKIVVNGIRALQLPKEMKSIADIQANAITDFSRIEQDHLLTTDHEIHQFPVASFFDSRKAIFKKNLFLNGVRNVIVEKGCFFPVNRVGGVVTGPDFFDREEIIEKLLELISHRQNILLCAPRRYGKTSTLRRLADESVKRGFKPILIDLESIFTPQEFIAHLVTEVELADATEQEKNAKVSEIENLIGAEWTSSGEEFFRRIAERKERLLFLLDECPYMLDSFLGKDIADSVISIKQEYKQRTDIFVSWFSKQRLNLKRLCVFILTGSINLKTYASENSLDINEFSDFEEVRISFFDPETVRTYIESLLLGQNIILSEEIIDRLVEITTPGIPYIIQIIMQHVISLYRENPLFTVDDFKKLYQEKIIGLDGRRWLDTFERHFKRYGKRKPGATAILRELSKAGNEGLKVQEMKRTYSASSGVVSNQEFEILLNYLEYDFYIEKIKGTSKYRFASPLLRDYWQKNQR